MSNERCWPRAGALLAHLGAVAYRVVRAACATVADATASTALLATRESRRRRRRSALLLPSARCTPSVARRRRPPTPASQGQLDPQGASSRSQRPEHSRGSRRPRRTPVGAAARRSSRTAARAPKLCLARLARSVEPREEREAVAAAAGPIAAAEAIRRGGGCPTLSTRSRRGLFCERRVVTSCNAPARGQELWVVGHVCEEIELAVDSVASDFAAAHEHRRFRHASRCGGCVDLDELTVLYWPLPMANALTTLGCCPAGGAT